MPKNHSKAKKKDVNYRRGEPFSLQRCVACKFFHPRSNHCMVVEGRVKALDTCDMWTFYRDVT